ncbi:MAG: hypothetical protein Q8O88_02030 [bacterium]|nr:hypothetical protein [bacterium]
MIFTMTDEIAYKLGKFDFPNVFYSNVLWYVNKEPFELAAFFRWTVPGGLGWPCKKTSGNYETDWENIPANGTLDLNNIKDISHKLAYIRGRLSSYSVNITETSISVCYANSYEFRDYLAQFLQDVIRDKFVLLPERDDELGRRYNLKSPMFAITKNENFGTIPGTPGITLIAPKEVIDYIVG